MAQSEESESRSSKTSTPASLQAYGSCSTTIDPNPDPENRQQTTHDNGNTGQDITEMSLVPVLNALYLLSAVSGVSWGRFAPIYYIEVQNLTPSQIGIVEGTMPLLRMVCKPIWGLLSDISRRRKMIMILTTTLGNIALMLFAFPLLVHGFTTVLAVSGAVAILTNGGLLDAFALEIIGKVNRLLYGRMRLFASVGWGVGNLLMGLLTDRFGFVSNFIWMGISALLFLFLAAFYLPYQTKQEVSFQNESRFVPQKEEEKREEDGKEDKRMSFPTAIVFYIEVAMMGVSVSVVERMLFVFLKDPQFGINASTFLCGLSVCVSTLLEIPIFYYAKTLTKHLGQNNLMLVSTGGIALRTFILTKVTRHNVGILLLVAESLHGAVFAGFWIVAVDRAACMLSRRWGTTAQMLLQAVYGGIGAGVGSIAAGYMFQIYGPVAVYSSVSYMMLGVFGIRLTGTLWKGLTSFFFKGANDYPLMQPILVEMD